jgi:hypothetical protein
VGDIDPSRTQLAWNRLESELFGGQSSIATSALPLLPLYGAPLPQFPETTSASPAPSPSPSPSPLTSLLPVDLPPPSLGSLFSPAYQSNYVLYQPPPLVPLISSLGTRTFSEYKGDESLSQHTASDQESDEDSEPPPPPPPAIRSQPSTSSAPLRADEESERSAVPREEDEGPHGPGPHSSLPQVNRNLNETASPRASTGMPSLLPTALGNMPRYATAQLPHSVLLSPSPPDPHSSQVVQPGADYSIFSAAGPFGPFDPSQFLPIFRQPLPPFPTRVSDGRHSH